MSLARFGHPVDPEDILLPVCDALTLEALRRVGQWILRHDRSRVKAWRGRPSWEAYLHPEWGVGDEVIGKALRHAWALIPVMLARWEDLACLDEEELMNLLDSYVHDLVVTRSVHTVEGLRVRVDSVFPPA